MIAMVEGAARKKTPNELALQIFLLALSIIFVLVTLSLYAYSWFTQEQLHIVPVDLGHGADSPAGVPGTDDHRGAAFGYRHCRA
jgi:hypothetical protein